MSMKSFDKFCERMIVSEPGTEKEIYDERQKQQRTRLTVEALAIYAVMSFLLAAVNETLVGWCDGSVPVMVVCMALAYMWWIIRNGSKGSLFGVTGKSTKYTAVITLIWIPFLFLEYVLPLLTGEKSVISDGKLSGDFLIAAAFVIFILSAVLILVLYSVEKRRGKTD